MSSPGLLRRPAPAGHRRAPLAALAAVLLGAGLGCGLHTAPSRELQVLSPALPSSLDAYSDTRITSENVHRNVFEPLVGSDNGETFRGAIAESWVNPAPDLFEFHLRKGVRFHDGSLLTADDVVASLRRARTPTLKMAGFLADVVELSSPGPDRVLVRTKGPVDHLLNSLTTVTVAKGDLGTGPYRVASFEPEKRVELVRFDGYWGARPDLERVTFRRFTSAEETLAAMREPVPTMVISPLRDVIRAAEADPRFVVQRQTTGSLYYVAFEMRKRDGRALPFQDLRVRRALRAALDLQAVAETGTAGGGLPATQLVPPGIFGFDPRLPVPHRDLAKARALLREAGYPAGVAVPLDVSLPNQPLADEVARQAAEAGIRFSVRTQTSEEFWRRIEEGAECFLFSWVMALESGEALRSFLHTRDVAKGLGLRNRTGYSSARFDRAIEEAMGPAVPSVRLERLQVASATAMEDLPWVPLVVPKTVRVLPKGLKLAMRPDALFHAAEARWEDEP